MAITKMNGYAKGPNGKLIEIVDAAARTDLEEFKRSAETAINTLLIESVKYATKDEVSAVEISTAAELDDVIGKLNLQEDALNLKIDGAYADEEGYLYLTSNGDIIVGPIGPFAGGSGGGGGGGAATTLRMTNTTGWLSTVISESSSCSISVDWSSTEEDEATGDGSISVRVGGITKLTRTVAQGPVTINIKNFLAVGVNSIRVTVTDSQGNSRSLMYTVNVVSLKMSSTFDDSSVYTGEVSFPYVPTGSVAKTVHFKIDGVEIGTEVISASGRQQRYKIPQQSHGAHMLEAYFTAEIDGNEVESNHLFYSIMFVDLSNPTPIVSSSFANPEVEQYYQLVIPYVVYDPTKFFAPVVVTINGNTYLSTTVDRTKQTFVYTPNDVGDLIIDIKSGTASKTIRTTVTKSSIKAEATTEDLALYLSAKARSNGESHPEQWSYGSINATLTGFNFTSDGWQLDDDHVECLRVSGDARVTIPYKIFAKDFKVTGKTIEFEFATSDVRDYDTTLVNCMAGNVGMKITPQRVSMASTLSTISTQYKEDEHVRVSFVVEKSAEHRLIYCYINGIISGIVQYPASDSFSQLNPVNISIGSSDCTIDIYAIRVYDNDLTRQQMLDNWIADTANGDLKIERYERNNIFDDYAQIVIGKLPEYLPYMVLSAPELPQYKGDKKTVSGYYKNPKAASKNFTFTGATCDVQGTSSQYYARKNYKIKFPNFVDDNGNSSNKYAIRSSSIPVNTFTFKADVASSEGANNVELVGIYNDICPVKTPPQVDNPGVRQGIDGFPIVIFWDNGEDVTFLGKYNFNNDKGTEDVFGFSAGDESWEILNNTSDRVIWKNANYAGTDWLNDFEGRYPDGNKDPKNLSQLAAWIVSTDGNIAKFKNEISNYLDVNDTIFYYLFTELFLMVDSRAKNAFPTLYKNGKWQWLPYDMDTAIGINNEGALAFDYNLEDTDQTESGADVYNGQNSVLWNNLRQAFPDEIKAMYQSLRAAGLTYDMVESRFEEHQSKWSEAIFNEDAYFKYIAPLIESNEGSYLSMCQGSKAEQRKWWLYNRFRYMDSKYETGYAASNYINVRAYALSDVTVTPYADIYARVKWGSYDAKQRANRNVPVRLHCGADNLNDTECMIYSADQLKSVGDLSGLKVGYANFAMGTKLVDIKIGDKSASYSNGNLTELYLGNNTLLKTLDVRNCPNLTMPIDLKNCSNIEEVYFDGTSITGVELPNGGLLRVLHLPNTVTSLKIQNQTKITDFVLNNPSIITTLWLENVASIIDPLYYLSKIPDNSLVRIIGFDKTVSSTSEIASFYDSLDEMRGIDANGHEMDKAQISGTIHIENISGSDYASLKERYPGITIQYSHITSKVYFYNYDGSTLLSTKDSIDGAAVTYTGATPTRPSTAQFTFTFNGWAIVPDGDAVSDALTNIAGDKKLYAAYLKTVRTYTIKFVNNSSGTTKVLQTSTLAYGSIPKFNGSIPVYEGTDTEDYGEFNGWDPMIVSVTGDVTYVAIFPYIGIISYTFIDRTIKSISSNKVESVGSFAFANCSKLTSVDLPSATKINESAFNSCSNLTSVDLPSVTNIGIDAFKSCSMLTSVYLPSVRTLTGSAFQSCSRLTSVDLHSVTNIGVGAFQSCSGLKALIIRTQSVCSYSTSSSSYDPNSSNLKIYVPRDLVESYKTATNWSRLASKFVALEDYTVDGTITGEINT